MQIVDRDTGSAIAFMVGQLPRMPCYYREVPVGFKRPSMFFPEPELDAEPDTLDSFMFRYTMRVHFFGRDSREGYTNAQTVLRAIAENRFSIPVLTPDGEETGDALDVSGTGSIRQTEDLPGACILTVRWDHRERYPVPELPAVTHVHTHLGLKHELYDLDKLLEKA